MDWDNDGKKDLVAGDTDGSAETLFRVKNRSGNTSHSRFIFFIIDSISSIPYRLYFLHQVVGINDCIFRELRQSLLANDLLYLLIAQESEDGFAHAG